MFDKFNDEEELTYAEVFAKNDQDIAATQQLLEKLILPGVTDALIGMLKTNKTDDYSTTHRWCLNRWESFWQYDIINSSLDPNVPYEEKKAQLPRYDKAYFVSLARHKQLIVVRRTFDNEMDTIVRNQAIGHFDMDGHFWYVLHKEHFYELIYKKIKAKEFDVNRFYKHQKTLLSQLKKASGTIQSNEFKEYIRYIFGYKIAD